MTPWSLVLKSPTFNSVVVVVVVVVWFWHKTKLIWRQIRIITVDPCILEEFEKMSFTMKKWLFTSEKLLELKPGFTDHRSLIPSSLVWMIENKMTQFYGMVCGVTQEKIILKSGFMFLCLACVFAYTHTRTHSLSYS